MHLTTSSTLFGLCLNFFGAFLLSAEAIGINTIRKWRESYLERPVGLLEEKKTVDFIARSESLGLKRFGAVMHGLGGGLGGAAGTAAMIFLKDRGFGKWSIVGAIVGAAAGYFFFDGVRFLMIWFSKFFMWVEVRSGQGTIGLIGFAFLALGFIFQALGTGAFF